MTSKSLHYAAIAAMLGVATLSGCKKKEEPVPTPPATTDVAPPPAPAPAPVAATASVTGVDLGTAVGSDMKVTAPKTEFAKNDTIIAAVSTHTSDAMASVPGALSAKWTYQDGQVVNEESQNLTFAGHGVTDFRISKPDGFPAGNYKVEISLDGVVAQSKDFTVK
jgi:hypothetical protein